MDGYPESEGARSEDRRAEPNGAASRAIAWRPLESLPTTQSACCCSARPAVRVMMPPAAPGHEPVDLLLCGHHFRASRESLKRAGAFAFDASGSLIMPAAWERAREPLAADRAR
jgi:hypothetical protein